MVSSVALPSPLLRKRHQKIIGSFLKVDALAIISMAPRNPSYPVAPWWRATFGSERKMVLSMATILLLIRTSCVASVSAPTGLGPLLPSLSATGTFVPWCPHVAVGRREMSVATFSRGGSLEMSDVDDDSGELGESELESNFDGESDEDESEGEEETDDDEEESDEEEPFEVPSSTPIKLIVRTGLNCPLIDQTMEVTASRTRTIASIRQTVSRQMRGRPPISSIRLLLDGRDLRDDELLDDLAPDEEEENDEDLEDDEEEDGMTKLRLTLDAVPPVDPKFGVELAELMKKMDNNELLEAYAANTAAMHANAARLFAGETGVGNDNEDDDVDEEEGSESLILPASVTMRQHAVSVKARILEAMPEEAVAFLTNKDEVGANEKSSAATMRKHRKGRAVKGGASTHVKLVLQRNLNINWADTIRNFVLFLFFGYFGGRDPLSRTIMYLGAPMCFILQARPMKIALKQLFYTIGNPPGILLSLLPAPQQAIMSLDYEAAIADLYGKEGKALRGHNENFQQDEYDVEEGDTDFDDEEYDDYDEDY